MLRLTSESALSRAPIRPSFLSRLLIAFAAVILAACPAAAMIVENEKVSVSSDYRFSSLFSFTYAKQGSLKLELKATLNKPVNFMLCSDTALTPLRETDITFEDLCRDPEVLLPQCVHQGRFPKTDSSRRSSDSSLSAASARPSAAHAAASAWANSRRSAAGAGFPGRPVAPDTAGSDAGEGLAGFFGTVLPSLWGPSVVPADATTEVERGADVGVYNNFNGSYGASYTEDSPGRIGIQLIDTASYRPHWSSFFSSGDDDVVAAEDAALGGSPDPSSLASSPSGSTGGAGVALPATMANALLPGRRGSPLSPAMIGVGATDVVVNVDMPSVPTRDRYRFLQLNCGEASWKGSLSYTAMNPGGEYLSLTLVPYKQLYLALVWIWMAALLLWTVHWLRYCRWYTAPQLALSAVPLLKLVQSFLFLLYWRICSKSGRIPMPLYAFSFLTTLATRAVLFFTILVLATGWGMVARSVPRPVLSRIAILVLAYVLGLAMYQMNMSFAVLILILNYAILWQSFGILAFITRRQIETQAQLLMSADIAPSKTPLAIKEKALATLQTSMAIFVLADLTIHLWSSIFSATAPYAEDLLEHLAVLALWGVVSWKAYRMRPFNPHLNTLAKALMATLPAADLATVTNALRPRLTPARPAQRPGAPAAAGAAAGGGVAEDCLWYPVLSIDRCLWKSRKRSSGGAEDPAAAAAAASAGAGSSGLDSVFNPSSDADGRGGAASASLAARERERQTTDNEMLAALRAQAQATGSASVAATVAAFSATPRSSSSSGGMGGSSGHNGGSAGLLGDGSSALSASGIPYPLPREVQAIICRDDPSLHQLVAIAHEPCGCYVRGPDAQPAFVAGAGARRRDGGSGACPHTHVALLYSRIKDRKTRDEASRAAVSPLYQESAAAAADHGGEDGPGSRGRSPGLRGLLPSANDRYRQLQDDYDV